MSTTRSDTTCSNSTCSNETLKNAVICPYCRKPAELTNGSAIYPHRTDLAQCKVYLCKPCDARVGCHSETNEPLGTLANSELRRLRSAAHLAFDKIWKMKLISRSNAYRWLANRIGLSSNECHIAMFNKEQCLKAIKLSNSFIRDQK